MNMMHCRHIEQHELAALIALYEHLIAHDEPLPDSQTLHHTWQLLLQSPWHDCIVMIDPNDTLIGSCTVTYTPNLTRGARQHALIENMVIHTHYRNKGLGKQLMQYAIEQAWQRDCYKIALLARASAETARFYESLGFSGTGKLAYVLRKHKPQTD